MASKQASRRPVASERPLSLHMHHRLREGLLIVIAALSVFLFIALLTYHRTDPGWSNTGLSEHIANAGGRVGAYFADVLLYLFGYMGYVFPVMLFYAAWIFYRGRHAQNEESQQRHAMLLRSLGFVFILTTGCSLTSLYLPASSHLPFAAGGIIGNLVGFGMRQIFNDAGTALILFAFLLTGITLFTGLSWFTVADHVGQWIVRLASRLQLRLPPLPQWSWSRFIPSWFKGAMDHQTEHTKVEPAIALQKSALFIPRQETPVFSKPKPIEPSLRAQKELQNELFEPPLVGSLPSLPLLDSPKSEIKGYTDVELEQMSKEVELRLMDFGVEAKVVAVHPGPVITRFELELAPGTKANRVSNLAKDLARSLSVTSVRVVEVIPGKSVIGLELPNTEREAVRLREILSSQQYDHARSPLTLALGKDIAGHPVIVDLAKMPHLLVAGTTGSGKSVALNAMLLSFLYKAPPSELRMILIDPKMLEFSVYEGIPHLLTPVVTDMKDAVNALRWCVAEMERRYKLMASLGVRNISGYNNKVKEAKKKGTPLLDPLWQPENGSEQQELFELPYIVVIADEFADMMMMVGKKVEELIARLAQKARAAGIHLILATQRPSVDVITGLIKANIPTRIAFQVSSKIDSRTILDQSGAEQLLGSGDMLYLPPGSGVPVRVHGAFVVDDEVHRVVKDLKRRGTPDYLEEILSSDGGSGGDSSGFLMGLDENHMAEGEQDLLYDQAVQIVLETRRASISNIQRRLKIGYNRAARIVEAMEAAGLVGPMEGSGSREVLAPAPQEN